MFVFVVVPIFLGLGCADGGSTNVIWSELAEATTSAVGDYVSGVSGGVLSNAGQAEALSTTVSAPQVNPLFDSVDARAIETVRVHSASVVSYEQKIAQIDSSIRDEFRAHNLHWVNEREGVAAAQSGSPVDSSVLDKIQHLYYSREDAEEYVIRRNWELVNSLSSLYGQVDCTIEGVENFSKAERK
jgi:hypothetical protein